MKYVMYAVGCVILRETRYHLFFFSLLVKLIVELLHINLQKKKMCAKVSRRKVN